MDIATTKQQLIALVDKVNKENPGMSLEFHQQRITKKNMCVRGNNGSLWIEPFQNWYDIGLSGQSLTKQMQGFMEKFCGQNQGTNRPSQNPIIRFGEFVTLRLLKPQFIDMQAYQNSLMIYKLLPIGSGW